MVRGRTFEDLERIMKENKEQLRKRYNIKSIGIFGSRVRGEDRSISIPIE